MSSRPARRTRRARIAVAVSAILAAMPPRPPGEDESVAVDAYVLDTLMPDLVGHDRAPSAFIVYLHLWRQSHGVGAATVQTSLRSIAEGTGLSKRGVQEALTILAK